MRKHKTLQKIIDTINTQPKLNRACKELGIDTNELEKIHKGQIDMNNEARRRAKVLYVANHILSFSTPKIKYKNYNISPWFKEVTVENNKNNIKRREILKRNEISKKLEKRLENSVSLKRAKEFKIKSRLSERHKKVNRILSMKHQEVQDKEISALGQVETRTITKHISQTPRPTFVYVKKDTNDIDSQLKRIEDKLAQSSSRHSYQLKLRASSAALNYMNCSKNKETRQKIREDQEKKWEKQVLSILSRKNNDNKTLTPNN